MVGERDRDREAVRWELGDISTPQFNNGGSQMVGGTGTICGGQQQQQQAAFSQQQQRLLQQQQQQQTIVAQQQLLQQQVLQTNWTAESEQLQPIRPNESDIDDQQFYDTTAGNIGWPRNNPSGSSHGYFDNNVGAISYNAPQFVPVGSNYGYNINTTSMGSSVDNNNFSKYFHYLLISSKAIFWD